jgi:hypothetical protein
MMTMQAEQDNLKAAQARRNKGTEFTDPEDGDSSRETLSVMSPGKYMRQWFFSSLFCQLLSYVVLFSARSNQRPSTEGVCVDANHTEYDCPSRVAQGFCYSEHPGGNAEVTRETMAHCCKSCSGGPLESGGGMLYAISVLGMFFWGYQLGFVKSYLARGKDALGNKAQETVHQASVKLTWHAAGLFYPAAKSVITTVIYFATVLSLLYYYTENTGTCPRSPLQAITRESDQCGIPRNPWSTARLRPH